MFGDYIKIISLIFTPIISMGFISEMYYKYKDFKIYTQNTSQNKKLKIEAIFTRAIILLVFQIEYSIYG